MQTAMDYKYLNLINLIDFDLWDTKRYTSKSIVSSFPIVDLGVCIKEENKKYKIFEEEEKEFGILGVNNKEGIFDAYFQKGKDINQAYKKMEIGWLAYNPYRINVGSIGIRLKEHQNEYISPAYVVFSCLDNLLPEYLFLLFKTERFNKVINESTTGSVRQNLTIDTLKKLQIPLPTLAEQEAIVNAYQSKIQEAQNLEQQAKDLEREIERYLNIVLGIEYETKKKQTGLYFTPFKSLERWDLWNKNVHFNNSQHKLVKLNSLIKLKSGSFLPASKMIEGNYKVYGGNGQNGTHNNYFLEGKRLVIGRVGEYCGNVHLIEGKYWITDNAFIVDKITDLTSYEFLEIGLNHLNLNNYKVLSAQPSISQNSILLLEFPLPTLKEQEQIIENVQQKRNEVQQLTTKHSKLLTQAEQEFEQAIFS